MFTNKHKSSKSRWGRAFLAAASLVLSTATAFAQQPMRAWTIHERGYPITQALEWFASEVNGNSEGMLNVEVFPDAKLGDQPQALRAVEVGGIDFGVFNTANLAELVPSLRVLTLPFMFRDASHMFSVLDEPTGNRFNAQLLKHGFVLLGWIDDGARSFYCAKRQLRSSTDFEGLRIRVQKSDLYIKMVKALKAEPVVVPFRDVQQAFADGKIDCAENSIPGYESTGHYKLAPYFTETNHVISPQAFVASAKTWARMSPVQQKMVRAKAAEATQMMRRLWVERLQASRRVIDKAGVKIVPRMNVDYAPYVQRMSRIYAEHFSDPAERELLLTILTR